jgi:hypothetical protein
MADDDTRVTGKTIKLNKLKPNEYRLWVVQSEATFEVYKCLKLVLGKEPKPTPSPDDSDDESASVTSWDTRHALAREALLRSLEPSNLIKVITVKDSAPAIWKRLADEYGNFRFTGLETFEMIAANGFQLPGRSINNILHTSLGSQPEVNVAVTRSLTAAVRNEANRKQITEIPSDSEPEEDNSEEDNPASDSDSEPELQIAGAAAHNDDTAIVPLICKPRDLWHLRYGHASTTVLRKLNLIKSTFDSRKCVPCLHTKKTRKPFPPSASKVEAKLERIHSDICGQFPDSEDNTTYNLLFIEKKPHDGHILLTSKTSLLPLSKKNSQNTSQKSNGKPA